MEPRGVKKEKNTRELACYSFEKSCFCQILWDKVDDPRCARASDEAPIRSSLAAFGRAGLLFSSFTSKLATTQIKKPWLKAKA